MSIEKLNVNKLATKKEVWWGGGGGGGGKGGLSSMYLIVGMHVEIRL